MYYFKKIRLLHIKTVEILLPLVSPIKLSADEVQRISQKNKKKWLAAYPVPFHGAKEIGEGLRKKIIKEMGLR